MILLYPFYFSDNSLLSDTPKMDFSEEKPGNNATFEIGGDLTIDINNNTFVAIAESQEEPELVPEETEEERKERIRVKNNEKHKR